MKTHPRPASPLLLAAFSSLLLVQCVSMRPANVQISPPEPSKPGISDYAHGKRKLFVFMDGTNNKWSSRTNVRRLFEMIAAREHPAEICCYISGVGVDAGLGGLIMGMGMRSRIIEGYGFLSRHYRPGDEIYIFGFSRGALQARALAGLIAHSGLLPPDLARTEKESEKNGKKAWSFCRLQEEVDGRNVCHGVWKKGVPPLPLMKNSERHGVYAPVTFLGVWDTVPGSQFKVYDRYHEEPDAKPGMRYKIGAYPPLKNVAHAMSLDELRSQFQAVQVEPLPGHGRLNEVWFPGVHSDVGGGYDDANALSGLSMNWMIRQLNQVARFTAPLPVVHEDASAPAHESLDDFPGNLLSQRQDRNTPDDAKLHPSVQQRYESRGVYVRRKGDFGEAEPYLPRQENVRSKLREK